MASEILKYKDEADKSLGVAGMCISLVACDCEDMLASVSLEEGSEAVTMSEEFFFNGNPRMSAKIVWNELLKQFEVAVGMLIGNVMCRQFTANHTLDNRLIEAAHSIIIDEAAELCSLEADEAERVYNKNYRYYYRLFSHPGVCSIASDFATNLRAQRSMTAGEVIDHLRRLSNI